MSGDMVNDIIITVYNSNVPQRLGGGFYREALAPGKLRYDPRLGVCSQRRWLVAGQDISNLSIHLSQKRYKT